VPRGCEPLDHIERVFHAVNVDVKLWHIDPRSPDA